MEKSEAQTELSEIFKLKKQFDEKIPSALESGKLDEVWSIKAQIEERINRVNELLTPPDTFNKEQREALEAKGYVIHRLTGESIASIRKAGGKFQSNWHEGYPEFENLPSRQTEVAFNPDPNKFFLPGSNNKTMEEQEQMVDKYSKELQKDIKGVKAVIGEAPDYIELAFNYPVEYGPLFGGGYGYRFTRTKTPVKSNVIFVGDFKPNVGLFICNWLPFDPADNWITPLIVPEDK